MKISHQFVKFIPETLEDGVLYVSIPYRTASHLCMCGCNNKVVTPIRPERWQLAYNGQDISLFPSIGNWNLPCKSHYWIKHDQIEWSYEMPVNKTKASRVKEEELKQISNSVGKRNRLHNVWLYARKYF